MVEPKTNNQRSSEIVLCSLIISGQSWGAHSSSIRLTDKLDIKAWADCVVKWAAEDPYSFLMKAVSALTPLFLANVILPRKLARMIEARQKEQKKKQNRQETVAEAK